MSVDGKVVRTQGMRVDPTRARIEVDGERISVNPEHDYVVLNKPEGVVTSASDPQKRRTVLDLVESTHRLFPVGRLDIETTGLVLLTDNGELTHRLLHPSYQVRRVYAAEVRGSMSNDAVAELLAGVHLEDGPARAVDVRVRDRAKSRSSIEITMTEGRKREVRRMLEAVGHPVIGLTRIAFGPLRLGHLPVGASRRLSPREIGELLREVGL